MFGRNPKTFGVLAVTQEWVAGSPKGTPLPEYLGWLGTNKFFLGFAKKSGKCEPAMPKI
jgi:hypothetical protein